MREQLNILLDAELRAQINTLMKAHRHSRKSAAIRQAVAEAVQRLTASRSGSSLRSSLGIGLSIGKPTKRRRFRSHDALWS